MGRSTARHIMLGGQDGSGPFRDCDPSAFSPERDRGAARTGCCHRHREDALATRHRALPREIRVQSSASPGLVRAAGMGWICPDVGSRRLLSHRGGHRLPELSVGRGLGAVRFRLAACTVPEGIWHGCESRLLRRACAATNSRRPPRIRQPRHNKERECGKCSHNPQQHRKSRLFHDRAQ
jgi:hypothetical protein